MNIKKICISICLLILTGCGGSILDDSSLKTKDIQIQGISISSTSTSASIIWTTDIPSTHKIMYGTVSGTYTQETTVSTTESTTHQVDLSGLTTDITYYYKIVCTASGMETVESAEFSFTTSSTISVASLAAVSITTTSAEITWTTGIATTHIVEYGTVAGVYTDSTVQSTTASTSHAVIITGLTPGETYYYHVKNYHTTLPFSSSNELSFTTLSETATVYTATPSLHGAVITWTTDIATTHLVEYGTSPGVYTNSTIQSASAATAHSVTLSGLNYGTTYYYRVKNFNDLYADTITSGMTFTTTLPPTGKIYIIGGLSASLINAANTISEVDVYDPSDNSWTQTAPIPIEVSFAAVVGYNGKIYVMGGFNNAGNAIATTQIYDVATDNWTTGTDMSNARANHSAVAYNGKIYVTHGTTGATAATPWVATGLPLNSLIYTISNNSWSPTGYTDSSQSNRGVVLVDDVIYYMGGKSTATTYVNTVEGLLINYNNYTSSTTEIVLSSNRFGFASAVYTDPYGDSSILVVGGVIGPVTNAGCYVFSGATPTGLTAATFINNFQYLKTPYTYPTQTAWSSLTNLPALLGFGSAVVTGSTLYFFGGAAYSSATAISVQNVVYSYSLSTFPSSGSWVSPTSMPRARFGHTAVTVD